MDPIQKNPLNRMAARALAAICLSVALSAEATETLEKIAETGTIALGYRDSAPPFSYVGDGKQPIGYSIDICAKVVDAVRRQLKRPDIAVKFVPVSTTTRIPALTSGDIDLECGSTTNTAERRKQVAFTIPTFIAAIRLMATEASGIKSIYDLSGKTVVTTQASSSETLFQNLNTRYSLHAKLLLGKNHVESFSLLEAGKASAFLMDDVILYTLRATSRTPEAYSISREPLTIEPLAIMLRKDDPKFKKLVDAEVVRIITQGEIQGLYRKWFESPIPPNQVNLKMPMSYMLRDSFKAPTDWVPN